MVSKFLGTALASIYLVICVTTSALGGAGGGAAPGGGDGGSGPEPEIFALILFSLIPGLFFMRRALAARSEVEES